MEVACSSERLARFVTLYGDSLQKTFFTSVYILQEAQYAIIILWFLFGKIIGDYSQIIRTPQIHAVAKIQSFQC